MIEEPERVYWSVREVKKETGIPESKLRYWEERFSDFKEMEVFHDPQGTRHYTKENIRFIKLLKHLRDELQITQIDAMKRWIRNSDENKLHSRQQAAENLRKIREELLELRNMI